MNASTRDERLMRRAIRLAARGAGCTHPNPVVGAVVARGDEIVGEGWHRALGRPHAEVEALRQAGRRARGATLYVTLEPCAHHGRTPPCVDAVIAAGVKRCVVAIGDPHPLVSGRGFRILRAAGIRVDLGTCAAAARELLGGYWHRHVLLRPRVTWKVAATLDGRIADARGRSRWITGPASRRRAHRMRAASHALVIGARTALRDDPRLTARGVRTLRQPLRVVCDTRLRLPLELRVFGPGLARGTVVACGRGAPRAGERALADRGVRVWRLPETESGVSPRALTRRLAREECHEVLLEGGAALGSDWMRSGVIDRVALFVAPRLLGRGGLDWCGPLGVRRLEQARRGTLESCERVDDDALLVLRMDR